MGYSVQGTAAKIAAGDSFGEKAAPTVGQYQLKSEPADVGGLGWASVVWIDFPMLGIKSGTPVDIDIAVVGWELVCAAGNQDQSLVKQVLDLDTGTLLRAVHQRQVHCSRDDTAHQITIEADRRIQRNIAGHLSHTTGPARQKVVPQRSTCPDGQAGAKSTRQTNVVPRLLEGE